MVSCTNCYTVPQLLMLKLKHIPKRSLTVEEEPGIALSIGRVCTGEAAAADLRKLIKTIPGEHPFLGYLNTRVFTDEELLDRQTEVVGALARVIKSSFGTVKANIVKIGGSSKGLPGIVSWLGYGTTWGGLAIMVSFDLFMRKAFGNAMKSMNLNTDGISDVDGLTNKREGMAADATMNLKDKVWPGSEPLTPGEVSKQLWYISGIFLKLDGMANTLQAVMDGKMDLDTWLTPIKLGGGTDVWSIRPIHNHKGFMLYRNEGKMFLEVVVDASKLPSKGVIPTTKEMMDVQKAAKDAGKSFSKAEKHIKAVLGKHTKITDAAQKSSEALATDENAAKTPEVEKTPTKEVKGKVESTTTNEHSSDGIFAFNALKVLFEESAALAQNAMEDAANYLNDSIAAILTHREGKEDDGKSTPSSAKPKSKVTDSKAASTDKQSDTSTPEGTQ